MVDANALHEAKRYSVRTVVVSHHTPIVVRQSRSSTASPGMTWPLSTLSAAAIRLLQTAPHRGVYDERRPAGRLESLVH